MGGFGYDFDFVVGIGAHCLEDSTGFEFDSDYLPMRNSDGFFNLDYMCFRRSDFLYLFTHFPGSLQSSIRTVKLSCMLTTTTHFTPLLGCCTVFTWACCCCPNVILLKCVFITLCIEANYVDKAILWSTSSTPKVFCTIILNASTFHFGLPYETLFNSANNSSCLF